ncbi:MAG: TetR/AcrR family transcriptional regulator [Myxococcota bacterium]
MQPSDPEQPPRASGRDTASRTSQRTAPARGALRPDDGRLVRGRESRARIRRAARELFRERGFDGATLRAIAQRAGMGASSIYRHVRSKEELLILELADLQEEAWRAFRQIDRRDSSTRQRIDEFLAAQHQLLVADRDLVAIALRSLTRPGADASRRVLALNDRTVGLLVEIIQSGRMRGEIARDADVLAGAQAIFHLTLGVRIAWANGQLADDACLASIQTAVELLFRGIANPESREETSA